MACTGEGAGERRDRDRVRGRGSERARERKGTYLACRGYGRHDIGNAAGV